MLKITRCTAPVCWGANTVPYCQARAQSNSKSLRTCAPFGKMYQSLLKLKTESLIVLPAISARIPPSHGGAEAGISASSWRVPGPPTSTPASYSTSSSSTTSTTSSSTTTPSSPSSTPSQYWWAKQKVQCQWQQQNMISCHRELYSNCSTSQWLPKMYWSNFSSKKCRWARRQCWCHFHIDFHPSWTLRIAVYLLSSVHFMFYAVNCLWREK